MLTKNSISILIHSRSNPNILREILESLCRQTVSVTEIIVVHTGIVDIEARLIESYRQRLPLQYFFKPGKRASYARNKGVAASSGSIIAFLDDDCLPDPDWVAVIEGTFQKQPSLQVIQGNILIASASQPIQEEIHRINIARTLSNMVDEPSGFMKTLNAKNCAVRGKLLRKFRMPFDERLDSNDDVDFYWKLQQEGIPVLYVDEMRVKCIQTGNLKNLLMDWYHFGFGKAHLRKIHDEFWDTLCVPLDSWSSVWTWFYREIRGSWLKRYVKVILKKHRIWTPISVYVLIVIQRLSFLYGFVQGNNKKVPDFDHIVTPQDLFFSLTNRCNLRCAHCFFHASLESHSHPIQEISVCKIKIMLKNLNRDLNTVSFAGGEPFLNDDIVSLCRLCSNDIHVKNVYVVTNGFDSSKIVTSVAEILETTNYNFFVRISLDGLAETHNRIRNHRSSFEHAVDTIKALNQLAEKNSRLQVQVQTTIGGKNIGELNQLAKFVAQELKVFQAFEITRDFKMFSHQSNFIQSYGPRDSSLLLTSTQLRTIEKDIQNIYDQYFSKALFNRSAIDFQLLLIRTSCQQTLQGRPIIRCTTGESMAVIFQNYDVSICEAREPIGNLREFDFNLQHLLKERFTNRLETCRDVCFCTNSCNNSSSILALKLT